MATSTDESSKLIDKIRKLLALADPSRGATDAEAQAAFAKARELMIKHGLEHIDFDEKPEQLGATVNRDQIKFKRRQYGYDRFIANILKKCFSVKILTSTWLDHETKKERFMFVFVGQPEDMANAREFYEPLRKAFHAGLSNYLKSTGRKWSAVIERGYYDGLMVGFLKANAQAQALIYKQANKDVVDKYAIVLANKDAANDEYIARTWGKLKIVKHKTSADTHAWNVGTHDGKNLNLQSNLK